MNYNVYKSESSNKDPRDNFLKYTPRGAVDNINRNTGSSYKTKIRYIYTYTHGVHVTALDVTIKHTRLLAARRSNCATSLCKRAVYINVLVVAEREKSRDAGSELHREILNLFNVARLD